MKKLSKVILALAMAMFLTSVSSVASDCNHNQNNSSHYEYNGDCCGGYHDDSCGCEDDLCAVYKRRTVRFWHKYKWTGKYGALRKYLFNLRAYNTCIAHRY